MFIYYFKLALRSLRRNVVLTALMVAAIGVGIGASMTTADHISRHGGGSDPGEVRAVVRAADRQLGAHQQEGGHWRRGAVCRIRSPTPMRWPHERARGAPSNGHVRHRHCALTPPNPDLQPFQAQARATYRDFFQMFEVPFLLRRSLERGRRRGPRRRRRHLAQTERQGIRRRE